MFQFHSQNCRLKRVQAKVSADDAMIILWLAAMNPKHLHNLSEFFIIGDDHSAVTESAEILAGEKEKQPISPDRSRLPSFTIPSPDRLRRIFDHMDALAL